MKTFQKFSIRLRKFDLQRIVVGMSTLSYCPKGISVCWVAQLCPATPCSPVHAIFQERILERVAISYSSESSSPRDGTCVPCMISGFFTTEPRLSLKCLWQFWKPWRHWRIPQSFWNMLTVRTRFCCHKLVEQIPKMTADWWGRSVLQKPDPPLGKKDWVTQVPLSQKVSVQTPVCTACCFSALCEDRRLKELNRVYFHSQGPEPCYVAALEERSIMQPRPCSWVHVWQETRKEQPGRASSFPPAKAQCSSLSFFHHSLFTPCKCWVWWMSTPLLWQK